MSLDNEVIWKGLSLNRNSTEEIFLKLSRLGLWDIYQNIVSNPSAHREVVNRLIQSGPNLLEFSDDSLKVDREVVLAAVKSNGYALKHADTSLQTDREFILAAVQLNNDVLYFVDEKLIAELKEEELLKDN